MRLVRRIMRLVRRLVLEYYRKKLRTIAIISPRKAAKVAFKLFCTPYSRPKNFAVPPVFSKGEKLSFLHSNYKISGFKWKPENENGFKILICHGFDGFSYRFERYIEPLLENGFEVLSFDAPGHGLSTGKQITLPIYRDMILEINERFGPINGIVSHSLGGLGAGLALEKIQENHDKRFVLISPATESTRAIKTFFTHLKVSSKVQEEFEKLIIELAGYPSSWYSISRIMQEITTPTLWVHDKEDSVTPFEDMKHMIEKNLPHIQFEITEGLGHSSYNNDKIADCIISFLCTLTNENSTV